jgi:predicted  nucleic acid-binding Zn-ribbon protein
MIVRSTESLIDELLAVLDEEIELLEQKQSQLADLSDALVAVDDVATEALLKQIEQTERTQTMVDLKLQDVRKTLAGVLGYDDARALRLSVLVTKLPDAQASAVDDRRGRLAQQVGKLRRQHLQTAMLLIECSKVNRMMMECLLPAGEAVTTYDATGTNLWRNGAGLVDKEL